MSEYMCPQCGTYYGTGGPSTHTCSMNAGFAHTPVFTQYPMSPFFIVDNDTKAILERIAKALEKIANAR